VGHGAAVDRQRVTVGGHGAVVAAVHGVELEEVRGGGGVALELVDVDELEFGVVAQGAQDEAAHAAEAVDADAGGHAVFRSEMVLGGRIVRMRASRSATTAANAAAVFASTGSAIDQCHQLGAGSSSSWARSHTVTTWASGSIVSTERGVAPVRSKPARRAAATAPGCTFGAGWVPADSAGWPVRARHSEAASCERAE